MRRSPTEPDSVVRALFYGLGADGTVGANKNSIKIIGENTDNYAQGYFVYDSKKSGAMTVSHLRFGPQPIHSSYLVTKANFIACHQWIFLERYDMLSSLVEGGVFLLNSPFSKEEVWDHLPREVQTQLIAKKAKPAVDRRLTGGRAGDAGNAVRGARTPSCRSVSSPSRKFCRATKPSKPFANRFATPTARRAKTSCRKTCRRSTRRWLTCSK